MPQSLPIYYIVRKFEPAQTYPNICWHYWAAMNTVFETLTKFGRQSHFSRLIPDPQLPSVSRGWSWLWFLPVLAGFWDSTRQGIETMTELRLSIILQAIETALKDKRIMPRNRFSPNQPAYIERMRQAINDRLHDNEDARISLLLQSFVDGIEISWAEYGTEDYPQQAIDNCELFVLATI